VKGVEEVEVSVGSTDEVVEGGINVDNGTPCFISSF
jgi:hypothetical protein